MKIKIKLIARIFKYFLIKLIYLNIINIKVINQIKSKDDFKEPIIIKKFDLNNSVFDLKKRIYEEIKLKNPINNLGVFYTVKEKERKNKLILSEEKKP